MVIIQAPRLTYFGDTFMANAASGSPTARTAAAATRQLVLNEIRSKWGKFSEQDLSALKSKDDVVSQLVAKYGLEPAQAQRDVDALMKDRQIEVRPAPHAPRRPKGRPGLQHANPIVPTKGP
jgi:hypothetical protein